MSRRQRPAQKGGVTLITNPRQHTKLRLKQSALPLASTIIGEGIDVTKLPEGHLCCSTCSGYKFECWMYGDNRRIEMGCMQCGGSTRLVFPLDIKLDNYSKAAPNGIYGKYNAIGEGRFQCGRHPAKGMILIHNVDVISIGCESCFTELNICLRKAKGIVLTS